MYRAYRSGYFKGKFEWLRDQISHISEGTDDSEISEEVEEGKRTTQMHFWRYKLVDEIAEKINLTCPNSISRNCGPLVQYFEGNMTSLNSFFAFQARVLSVPGRPSRSPTDRTPGWTRASRAPTLSPTRRTSRGSRPRSDRPLRTSGEPGLDPRKRCPR